MNLPTRSRRLGQRVHVHGLVLSWNTGGRRAPKWKRSRFAEADVVDVSFSGAQLLAPSDPKLQVGSRVTIVAGNAIGSVIIRRIAPLSQENLTVYGVEFITLERPLEALLLGALNGLGPGAEDIVWR